MPLALTLIALEHEARESRARLAKMLARELILDMIIAIATIRGHSLLGRSLGLGLSGVRLPSELVDGAASGTRRVSGGR